jgi:hypothetical protein
VSWKSGEAQTCGVSPQTVSTYRTAQVSKLDTSPGTTREGRDGKQQPATKPKRVTASPEAEQQTARLPTWRTIARTRSGSLSPRSRQRLGYAARPNSRSHSRAPEREQRGRSLSLSQRRL